VRDIFQEELDAINADISQMADFVMKAISRATESLLFADRDIAESVIESDVILNDLAATLDERCIILTSKQQPAAMQLRKILGSMRIASSMERMGDLAVHVAKSARLRYPARSIPDELVETFRTLGHLAEDITNQLKSLINTPDVNSATSIQNSLNISNPELTNYAQNLAGGLLGIVSSIVGFIFNLFTVLLFTFYFAAEAPTIRKTIAGWLPAKQQLVFSTVWKVATEKTGGFVISRIILAGLNAVFTSIFLLLIDVPYWLPLGIFTGVISQFIPTIGSYIGGLIPAIVAIVNQPLDGLWVIIFVTIYQQIENYVFTPRISSLTMDIHPAVAFASVFIFAGFFGVIGALIGVPVAAAIIALIQTYGKRYELVPELNNLENKN